jgi:branched-chain amino acid transport system permease protein
VSQLLTALLSGIALGGIYAIVGMSYSLVFRTTGVFNFAQGDFVMLGTLIAWSLWSQLHLPAILVLVLVTLLVALAGPIVDLVAVLPAQKVGDTGTAWLVSTLGVSLIIENLAQHYWGSDPLQVPSLVNQQAHLAGSVSIPSAAQFLPAGLALLVAAGFVVFRRRTLVGRAFDAAAEDGEAAELRRIDTRWVSLATFFIGGAVAGLGGVIIAPVTFAAYNLGASFAVQGFLAMAIGGFGEVQGALVGGMIVGCVESISGLYIGAGYESLVMLVVVTAIMVARPGGLFGTRTERAV